MSVFCDKCGFKNESGAKFCKGCGVEVLQTSSNGTLLPGILLDGRYEIKRLIKTGGMGSVYEATDTRFQDSPCAVKEMLELEKDQEDREYLIKRFKEEADILYKLKHSSLPDVKDYFVESGRYYLVMSYVEGKDLEAAMKECENKQVPVPRLINWAKQILDVLDYLHSQSPPVVYRDMKPSNVMVDSNDKIMLIDFGIARTVNPCSNTTKTTIGTPGFAPPELYEGKPDQRSDIYSLGATMHALLSGILPLSPYSFSPLREANETVPVELENVILKALEMKASDRYQSAREMKEALDGRDNNLSLQPTLLPTLFKSGMTEAVPGSSRPAGKIKFIVISAIALILLSLPFLYLWITSSFRAYTEGMKLIDEGRYEEAMKAFDKSLHFNPSEAWTGKGIVYLKTEKYPEAVECFDKSLESNNSNISALPLKGLALIYQDKGEGGFLLLSSALKIAPASEVVLTSMGKARIYQGKYDDAIKSFNKALKINPEYVEALDGRGLAFYYNNWYEDSIKDFEKALKLNGNYVEGWNNLALAYYEYGNSIKQLEIIDEMMEENQKKLNPDLKIYKSERDYDYEKRYDKAFECLDRAMEINPDYAHSWYNKGYILSMFREYEEALECFNKATELNPEYLNAWREKCYVLRYLGQIEEAEECNKKVEELEKERSK